MNSSYFFNIHFRIPFFRQNRMISNASKIGEVGVLRNGMLAKLFTNSPDNNVSDKVTSLHIYNSKEGEKETYDLNWI